MSDPRYPELYKRDEARKSKSGPVQRVLTVIVGAVLPVRYTGKLYLVRELQKFGVDTARIPEACLRELTDEVVSLCKLESKIRRRSWRGVITDRIEGTAFLIARCLAGDKEYLSEADWFTDILRKYRLLPDAPAS
jgi:hypothetical protein